MMIDRLRIRVGILSLWLGVAAVASAQNFTFAYRTTATPTPQGLDANGTILAPAVAVGSTGTVTLIIQSQSGSVWTLNNATTTGPAFTVASTSNNQVLPGGTLLVNINFKPTAGGPASDNLSIGLQSGSQVNSFDFLLTGTGLKANFIPSYILNPNGNQVALGPNLPIVFAATPLNTTATATFILLNSGTGPGTVQSVAITGTGFTISGLSLLPAQVPPNSDLRFTINFLPTTRGAFTGALAINLGDSTLAIPLQGQSVGAFLSYSATVGTQAENLNAATGLTFPSTNLGSKATAAIRIDNTGDASATINNITVVGNGLSLTGLPPLPATIPKGGTLTFTVVFAPQTAGAVSGSLIVDGFTIPISSTAVGSSLVYNSLIGSANTQLADGGTIVFPNTDIGGKNSISIVVSNTGNAPATVAGISTSGPGFSTPSLPALPATIAPGQSLQFLVWFTATTVGSVSGVLQIDSFGVNLKGVGNAPPPLGDSSITGISGSINALTQPAIGLSLAKPYPLAISGTLTLSFTSDSFSDDPNIQFASGGRTVAFTIPANTTDALFSGSKQVQFQSGTVAGTINVSASFAIGSVDITPASPPAQSVVVQAGPPQLRNVQVGTVTANSFELLITGYSTARSVSTLNLQFTAAAGANLQTSSLSINSEAPFSTWFQSATGIGFGSQFTASVIVNVTGDVGAVQSVSVVASNSRGDSNALSVSLR
jgi:HYDIN/CFA65/VesB-like, Ig-like domain